MSWPWSQLGLTGPSSLSQVRRAYAEKLKITHPEEDPEGFQRLHSAYQMASRMARQQKRGGQPPQPEQTARPPQPAQPPQSQEEFDYDELLREEGEQPRLSHRDDREERDFDFDELLLEDETPPRSQEKTVEFDFERLFAEGEAERAEARRRRGEERRKTRQFQERQQRDRREERLNFQFRQEQDRWQNTETILHTIEMMYNARAEAEVWQKFFLSPLFQQTKGNLDLIFGLEDFVSTKNLSQEVQFALFMAYGFDKGVSRPELRPLFQMLLPAWKAQKKAGAFPWKSMMWGFLGAVVFLFGIGLVLDSGLVPLVFAALGLVWVAWVVRKAVLTGSMGRNVSKQKERRSTIIGIACVVGLVLAMYGLRSLPEDMFWKLLPTRDPREQTCRYIEKDFGIEVGSLYNLSETYAKETYGNVFYLESDPNGKQFLAGPDGDRDRKNGKAGYTTNLPEMLLLWRLRELAKEHGLTGMDTLDKEQKMEPWNTTGVYLIPLPIEGGEDIIRDLGELADELSQEKWYQSLAAAKCSVTLCSEEMEAGRMVMIRWHPGLEKYSTEQILGLYEESFAHACCAQIIKELELDRDFLLGEGECYTLTNEGKARIKGYECFKLFGLNEDGAVAMEYYVYPKLRNIYCVPGNFWETGNSEDQLNFYRLLYWGDRGTFNLFYPWLKVN